MLARSLPVVLLPARLLLFAGVQALIAVVFVARGVDDAWNASVAWWPFAATITNLVTLWILAAVARREGLRLRDLYALGRQGRGDVLPLLAVLLAGAVLGALPPVALAGWLFAVPSQAEELMLRPLPQWAALISIVAFPATIALSELPFYFGYAMPRLALLWKGRLVPARG